MSIKRRLASVGLIAALGATFVPVSHVQGQVDGQIGAVSDPIALYGREIRFDVLRDGRKTGWHRVRFGRAGSDLTVSSIFQLQVDILFLTVFRYRYHSQATWREGQLDRLSVKVDDDGAPFAMEAHRIADRMTIKYGEETYSAGAPLYPTDHWNAGVLAENRVLNTLTGRVNRVTIRQIAREAVPTERGDVMATHYAYAGELETEVWYDDSGRWVKMRFAGRDGSTIDYICRRCQGGDAKEAQR